MSTKKMGINQRIQRFKLAQNKVLTDLGLFVFTRNRKHKDICTKKNIEYGSDNLQKYDISCQTNLNGKKLPVVFYFHGGAWCGGDKYGYTNFCEKLAQFGYVVVNVNYRLMPKVEVETCIDDCILAIEHFKKNCKEIFCDAGLNCDANFENTFFVGDSAGAHIASLLAGKICCKKIKLGIKVLAVGLYYGVFNFENISNDPSPIMVDLDAYWRSIYKDTAPLYKRISPTTYVTKDFPPTFMTSGEIDKLHFQSEVMARLLGYNGIRLDYLSFAKERQDGRHAFLNVPFLPSAKEAFERLRKFFESCLNADADDKNANI